MLVAYAMVEQSDSIERFDGHVAESSWPPKNAPLHFTKLPFPDLRFYCDLWRQISKQKKMKSLPEFESVRSSLPVECLADRRCATSTSAL